MKKIKKIFIATLVIFLLSFFTHNIFKLFPSVITSIFFPINESIWEHTKMILSTWIIFYIIEYLYLRKENKNNLITGIFFGSLTNILILLLLFTPTYYFMNKQENLIITLIIYFISIVLGVTINNKIINNDKLNYNKTSVLLIIILIIIYGYLTYYPLNIPLFIDYSYIK